jgi:Ca-activated chloride channel family protein
MRSFGPVLLAVLVPVVAVAQGRIIPRPCLPPPCRGDVCSDVRIPCPGPSLVQRTSSDVRVELADRVLRYEISETFVNRGGGVAEADYLFPLPKGAAFEDLKLSINGEMVSGETLGAGEARRVYEDIVRRSRDPALVEWMGYGLLRARIFPLNPNEEKRVVVRFQTVAEREGSALRVDYVRTGAPRGGFGPPRPMPVVRRPQDDGQQRPQLIEIQGEEPVATFVLSYRQADDFGEPYSPTHRLRVNRSGARRSVEAMGDGQQVTILLPTRRPNGTSVTMLPYAPGNGDGFALFTITPPAAGTRTTPRDVTFVVDVSGSMRGRKMEQAQAAGRQLLATLSPQDRLRLIDFSTEVHSFRDGFVPATRANVQAAERYLDALRAEGSTNISGALEEALGVQPDPERMPVLLFVTDGEPTVGERSPEGIAALAARLRGRSRVFTFGVGADVNAALIEQLAMDGRGTAHFVRPEESVERAVSLVASRLTSPLLTDVRVRAEGVQLRSMHPTLPADIFAGQDLVLLARYTGDGEARVTVEGRTPAGPVSWTERVRFPAHQRDNPFVARLWATQRIGYLAAEKRRNGGSTEVDNEIRDLGQRYGIPTEFSSYLVLEPGMRSNVLDQARNRAMRGDVGAAPAPVQLQSVVVGADAGAAGGATVQERKFEAAKSAAAQRMVTTVAAADSLSAIFSKDGRVQQRRVGDRIFTLMDGVWVDSRVTPTLRVVKVKAYSAAYFALAQQIEELRAAFALGDRVRIAGRTVVVEVSADGADTLAERDVAGIVSGW